ncbi:hypothetical protein GUJ93_ZPchr0012g21512 [Zizania palustris]|uniref:AIPP2-like SPOC-like domain-containing protein n=1 Tax=Zizania palustris TaxID=103762 RepID=A0A8J5WQ13_ZIZPA|nr:hypothetical protein GUJ93_ZPchr0012g21512 [Zizania palustris]
MLGGDRHTMVTSCSTSNRDKIKEGSLMKNLENGTSCSRKGNLEHVHIESNDTVTRNGNDKQDQKQNCSMDTSSARKLNMQNDVVTDSMNSEGLIDVNVCDICGDVGREYLLATCTRCLEGAEHTYCMRVKLDKVPDGKWLCEECHLKEDQNQTRSNDCTSKINILDGKNRHSESMNNPKTLKVSVTDLEKQQITSGTPVTNLLVRNNQKLHVVSTEPEARNTKCATPTADRLYAINSSLTLSRPYSLGSLANVKTPVPSPRGLLTKQPSFNNSNNEPKVKQLAEPVASKLKPAKHSPIDCREQGPIRKVMKSGSFKHDASVCKDSSSPKQKQSFQNETPRILKPVKPPNLERKASFNLQKPSIPSSLRPESSMKSGDQRNDQDSPRPGPSILKSSKRPGIIEKKYRTILSKSEKQGIAVHPTYTGVICAKDVYAVKASEPPIPRDNIKNETTEDGACETPQILVNNDNEMPAKVEVLSMPCTPMTCELELQKVIPRANASEDLLPEEVQYQHLTAESTGNNSSESAVVIQASKDILPESPQGLLMAHNLHNPDNKLNCLNLKQQDFVDQSSTVGSSFRALVIPQQTYNWQGIFEVSRPGNCPEMYDGFQGHLSTCASPKVLEIVKQLPPQIQLEEVPWHSSWPLQFRQVRPNEDNIALFFFAKDVESYERAYGKLLENMLAGDLSLRTNISGIELLIFTSNKLPEKIRWWNGLLYFWGVFYARKKNSSTELLVERMDHSSLEQINGPVNHLVCCPKIPQSLGIDLNECPADELCDPVVLLELETENCGASVDHESLSRSNPEDKKPNSCEIHYPEIAGTGKILLGSPTAVPHGIYIPTSSKGGLNIKPEYPSDTIGDKGPPGRDNMEEEESISKNEAPRCVKKHAGAIRSVSDDILAKTQAVVSFKEVSLQRPVRPLCSDEPSDSISKADFITRDSSSIYKRKKSSDGKYSTCSFGDDELNSKSLLKIHPLPVELDTSLNDVQHVCRLPADPCPPSKPIVDHVIHVLSSDDEGSPERHNSLSKASLKEEGSSPLLSLSLSMATKKNNIACSDTGGDGPPLSLSLGLPDVVNGNQALEMKQFLPEKPGMNTSLFL